MKALFVNHRSDSLNEVQASTEALRACVEAIRNRHEKTELVLLNSGELAQIIWTDRSAGGLSAQVIETELRRRGVEASIMFEGQLAGGREALEAWLREQDAQLFNPEALPADHCYYLVIYKVN